MGQDVSCMAQSCNTACNRHQSGDDSRSPYPDVGMSYKSKPPGRWAGEDDTAVFEEHTEEHNPQLPQSCRCLGQGAADLFGEANEQVMDFSCIANSSATASSVRRRPAPISPGTDSASSSGARRGNSGLAGSTSAAPSIAASEFTFGGGAAAGRGVGLPPEAVGKDEGKQLKDKAQLDSHFWHATKPGVEGHHVSLQSSPSSASTATPPLTISADTENRDQDEHDRAVAAYLKENGFSSINGRKRSSLVGYMPLHRAAAQGLIRMTDLLIKAGADPNLKNSWSQTPLDIARRSNKKGSHDGVVKLLEEATAMRGT